LTREFFPIVGSFSITREIPERGFRRGKSGLIKMLTRLLERLRELVKRSPKFPNIYFLYDALRGLFWIR